MTLVVKGGGFDLAPKLHPCPVQRVLGLEQTPRALLVLRAEGFEAREVGGEGAGATERREQQHKATGEGLAEAEGVVPRRWPHRFTASRSSAYATAARI